MLQAVQIFCLHSTMKRHGFAILLLATLLVPLRLNGQGLDYNILCTLQ